ncbi:butyryl-CoA:acetate CoA-transferase [Dysosmobacter sp.]|uniref:butyryl-CoA:acetate CoA-transferase n=1 Tax=Dysosmobacter sp. TaxID=2591382 RepID=UPI002A8838D7|nr:butyryl-CoA:acetate CoA-transferase [Dysosmobacter sp.]MDY3282223.1 butyryl-CoA:acetate CoA-transferase [Dysosmobacter sp.]
MDIREEYSRKLRTAEEAVMAVRSGDWIDYGWNACAPAALDRALAARYQELTDVKVRGAVLMARPAIFSVPDTAEHFTWNSWHMGGLERKLIDEGVAYYIPLRYSELPRYYRENVDPIHVAMIQVAPMDEEGYFSYGLNASHLQALFEKAEVIILEVNRKYPRCYGGDGTRIHISQVDMVVEGGDPELNQLPAAAPNEVDRAVANLIVSRIPNGACLQLGIGGMPNAVGSLIAQSDLKDLGVHTEMYVDAFVDMALAGKINGSKKAIDRGLQTFAFGAGTRKLYDYLHENPQCRACPVDYTNDARVIAQLDNFVSINNAVDVDLFGQVNAESSGIRHISGAGGQQDFVLGAYLSRGGQSFICCASTVRGKDGSVQSRIRPTLREGSVVTDTRCNVQYLVTEYGMVNLKGASTWERAERVISIAHPDFREELIQEAERMKIWRRSARR